MILARDLSVQQNKTYILKNINISLSEGEALAVVGHSGAGKTTLLKTLAGITNSVSHSLKVSGTLQFPSPRFGMIFQDSKSCLNPLCTIYSSFKKLSSIATHIYIDDEVIHSSLSNVHLEASKSLLSSYPQQLSGGMAQRIMLAMVLACGYDWILADEISSSLDKEHEMKILQLLKRYSKALILVTHRMYLIKKFCSKILILHHGKPIMIGSVQEVLRSKNVYIKSLFYNSLQKA